jgi:ATP-dependent RNA helicase RhlE
LGVSQTPVRDALIRLAAEGLVEVFPQHATVVSLIDLGAARAAHFLRRSIELEIVRELAMAPSVDLVASLRASLARQRQIAKNGDLGAFSAEDQHFHRLMYEAARVQDLWHLARRHSGQIDRLRRGTDVLVATPGRLMDLHQQGALRLDRVEILVLDEADRMLDMGFLRDIRRILSLLPQRRQTLLFSATFSPEIRQLATGFLHQPVHLQASPENQAAPSVETVLHPCDMARKPDLLSHLIRSNGWRQVLVFSRTKHGANRVAERLCSDGLQAAAIHGNKSQGARTRALSGFKNGELRVLVATDIAARGIDIQQLPHVVNLDLPNLAEDYVHRIGRTGRAGHAGHAVSLVAAEEHELLRAIERLLGESLPRQEVPGFEPTVRSAPPLDLSGGRGRAPRGGKPRRRG